VDCGDNGTCVDGICQCAEGYEGTLCESRIIDSFIGEWRSIDYSCENEPAIDVTLEVAQGNSIREIFISDKEDPEIIIVGNLTQDGAEIPSQAIEIPNSGISTINGSMTIVEDGTADIRFNIVFDGVSASCGGNFTKQ